MQSFVKDRGRASSPQNSQPDLNLSRQAISANAKVSLQKQQPQPKLGIPSRGLGNTQNTSAVMQQHAQNSQSRQGPSQTRDPYDTDAESLDTTVNHSIIEVEDSQKRDQQHHHHHQDQIVVVSDENSDPVEEEYEVSEEDDVENYQITQEDNQLLTQQRLQHLSHQEQVQFLQQARRQAFHTIEGDSYPTTTDGDPTEWEGGKEPAFEDQDNGRLTPLSLQRVMSNSQLTRPSAPQLLQREQMPDLFRSNQAMPTSSSLFQQSAALRNQHNSTKNLPPQRGQGYQLDPAALPLSLNPAYGQTKREIAPALQTHSNTRQSTLEQVNKPPQGAQRQPLTSVRVQIQRPKPYEGSTPLNRPSSARTKANPIIQQQPPGDEVPVGEASTASVVDYDYDKLFTLSYDELRNEDFDNDPRAGPTALSDDMLQKSLIERLHFVQKSFDAHRQSDFFRSLPTTEWEDAGDWFLDQFQSIIQRTKEARQSKRKLAQEFEHEVERRHKHVSKKQHQVEEAMNKMKMQGEGLVSRSPRSSKSPRPKKA
ncbi:Nn.00g022330.m01.CDS01 [Neocucurbitaria sp. VM-36]